MAKDAEKESFWKTARRGWKTSIILGLALIIFRFKAILPRLWHTLVKDGTTHTLNNALSHSVPFVAVVGGGVLLIYSLEAGFSKTKKALEINSYAGSGAEGGTSSTTVALRSIVRLSFLINAPVLYWALFVIVLIPQIVKLPNASLRIGSTSALAVACGSMVVIAVLAAHIGVLLTRHSYRSISRPPEPVAAYPDASAAYGQQAAYAQQQGAYDQQAGYAPSTQPADTYTQPDPYTQPGVYYPPASQASAQEVPATSSYNLPAYNQQQPYAQQQGAYDQQAGYAPSTQPAGANNPQQAQAPGDAEPPQDNNQPW